MPTDSGLAKLFAPRGVAFVGVSPEPTKYAGRALKFLGRHGFAGKVFAVNPKYQEVFGAPCFKDVRDLPAGEIDVAFIALAPERVTEVLEVCAEKGIGAAVVVTSGFGESGPDGAERQRVLRDVARRTGVRICGPNCIGVANIAGRVVLSFGTVFERESIAAGNVAIISQSGAFASNLADAVLRRGLGISYMVSSGNEADLTTGDYLQYIVEDPATAVVLVYMEGMRHAPAFLDAAGEALTRRKPIVLLRTGRSGAGQRAILSHTGSLAGDLEIEAAAFRKSGVMVVNTIEDLLETAMVMARARRPLSPVRRVGVVCIGSGGATGLSADLLTASGLELPPLSQHTADGLRALLPPFVTPQNPLDVAGYSFEDEAQLAGAAVDAFAADASFDAVMAVLPGLPHVEACVSSVKRVTDAATKPVIAVFCGGPYTDVGVARAREMSLMWSLDLERSSRAFGALSRYAVTSAHHGRVVSRAAPGVAPAPPHAVVMEHEAKRMLAEFGLKTTRETLVTDADAAVKAARDIGYPVALKVQSPGIPHKSDIGGVSLDIANDDTLRREIERMGAAITTAGPGAVISGYLVQEMVKGGVEVFVGVRRDPTYGHVLVLGPGGVLVEVMRNVAVELFPVDAVDVRRMTESTGLAELLRGVRGRPPADVEKLIDGIIRLTQFAISRSYTLLELDVNPLVATAEGPIVVDALIVTGTATDHTGNATATIAR